MGECCKVPIELAGFLPSIPQAEQFFQGSSVWHRKIEAAWYRFVRSALPLFAFAVILDSELFVWKEFFL
jgi:hypothetical protein